jgi:hypothetical protein
MAKSASGLALPPQASCKAALKAATPEIGTSDHHFDPLQEVLRFIGVTEPSISTSDPASSYLHTNLDRR